MNKEQRKQFTARLYTDDHDQRAEAVRSYAKAIPAVGLADGRWEALADAVHRQSITTVAERIRRLRPYLDGNKHHRFLLDVLLSEPGD